MIYDGIDGGFSMTMLRYKREYFDRFNQFLVISAFDGWGPQGSSVDCVKGSVGWLKVEMVILMDL